MKKLTSSLLAVEELEKRKLFAGGLLLLRRPAPEIVQVINKPIPRLEIFPGAQDELVSDFYIRTVGGRNYVRLADMVFLSGAWGEPLFQNTESFTLLADLNGKARDGCEAIVSNGFANYDDTVIFAPSRNLWVRPRQLVHFQVIADFSTRFSGDTFSVELAEASFRNIRGQEIPQKRVNYLGAEPTVHTLKEATFSVISLAVPETGTALAGQSGLVLAEFYARSNKSSPRTIVFNIVQGSLNYIRNPTLWIDFNWDGVLDKCVGSGLCWPDGRLTFLFDPSFQYGKYEIHADVAENLSADVSFQLGYTEDVTADDQETYEPLQGKIINGTGEGQIILWLKDQPTLYNFLCPARLIFSLDPSTPPNQSVAGNQQVTGVVFKATAVGGSFTFDELNVALVDQSAAAVVISASLYNWSTLLATEPYNPIEGCFSFYGINLPVLANTSESLRVELQLLDPFIDSYVNLSGLNVKLELIGEKATNATGVQIAYSVRHKGNDVWVYKSLPSFTEQTASPQGRNLLEGITVNLNSFNVAADSNGPVSLKQIPFTITINEGEIRGNPYLDNFRLFRGNLDITNQVEFSAIRTRAGSGSTLIVAKFICEQFISAGGTSFVYSLRATPHGFQETTSGNASVTTVVAGDKVKTGGQLSNLLPSGSLVWSDNSAIVHSDDVLNSSWDWFNGFGLYDLPLARTIVY